MKQIYFIMFFVFVLLINNASSAADDSALDGKVLSPGVIMLLLGDDANDGDEPGEVNEWEARASLDSPRVLHAVVADNNGYLYVIGGTSDAGGAEAVKTLYRYCTQENRWEERRSLEIALARIDAEIINDKIYIPGDSTTADTFVYDIETNTWSTIPPGEYSKRVHYRTVAIDHYLYVLGGIIVDLNESTNEVWILNTETEEWSKGLPMHDGRINFAAGVINGVIYVAGGASWPSEAPIMTAEKFTDEWSFIADIPDREASYQFWSYMADGVTDNALWLAGGRRASWLDNFHTGFYDPAEDAWTDSTLGSFPTLNQGRVYLSGAVASDGYFYAIGGRDGEGKIIYDTNERFRVK